MVLGAVFQSLVADSVPDDFVIPLLIYSLEGTAATRNPMLLPGGRAVDHL